MTRHTKTTNGYANTKFLALAAPARTPKTVELPPAPHSGAGGGTESRLVDPWRHDADFAVLFLGLCGQATKAIARLTGMSDSQVTYRLSKFGVSRQAIRNLRDKEGYSAAMIEAAAGVITEKLISSLGEARETRQMTTAV